MLTKLIFDALLLISSMLTTYGAALVSPSCWDAGLFAVLVAVWCGIAFMWYAVWKIAHFDLQV